MRKLIFAVLMSVSLHADFYTNYIDSIMNNFNNDFSNYNELVLDTSSAMVAMSNIDFNPDHIGWSFGVGIATVHTNYGNGGAYALGTQYGFKYGALNIKGSYKSNKEYILGSGFVIGF